MKKLFTNFVVKKDFIEVVILHDNKIQFVPVYQLHMPFKSHNMADLVEYLELVKKTIKSKFNKHNTEMKYSLLLDDNLYKGIKLVNVEKNFDLKSNIVDQKVIKQINSFKNNELSTSNSNYVINSNTYLYKLVQNDEIKNYLKLPENNLGNELKIYSSAFVVNNENLLSKIVETFKSYFPIECVLLESQCLTYNSQTDDKYQIIVNFDWRNIIISGYLNKKHFYYNKIECNTREMIKYLKNSLNIPASQIGLYMDAVLSNYDFYSKTRMELDNNEQKVYNFLSEIMKQIVTEVNSVINQNLNYNNVKVLLKGRNSEFLQKCFNEEYPNISTDIYDNKEAKLSNVRSSVLGATYLLSQSKLREKDLTKTLKDLPEWKPKNAISRFFSKIFAFNKSI
ncbi:MAG3720 family protein [Mycoplasma sp. Mirounga ES2805-ORL]|uniref:MAG3720 family protein n=1 Tax=Mycoplasma sp. Mirounga ES2805-ORL TaxID=754514 RepID=UPI00197B4E2C|nr:hypothetical protein [Mycoplasma sp. Mirounga ES2805-ORL]QSF13819.1 hypothetical protein JXZ90_00760 [Mycoplasma sp. Mirounga ES2805-ORL]